MKMKLLSLIFVPAISFAISNGTKATSDNTFDNVVKLKMRMKVMKLLPKFTLATCTGTLIAPNVILTAAHCTESHLIESVNSYTRYKGETDFIDTDSKRASLHHGRPGDIKGKRGFKIIKEYVHPEYLRIEKEIGARKLEIYDKIKELQKEDKEVGKELLDELNSIFLRQQKYDIAIVITKKKFRKIKKFPKVLHSRQLYDGDIAEFWGYGVVPSLLGDSSSNHNPKNHLYFGHNPEVNNINPETKMVDNTYYWSKTRPSVITTGMGLKDGFYARVTAGDSGGPLLSKGSFEYIYGIASYGQFGSILGVLANDPSVHLNLTRKDLQEWLESLSQDLGFK